MEISDNGRKSSKKLLIELSEEEHSIIKMAAANKGITIRKYVINAIVSNGKLEESRSRHIDER